jgi:PAS domain S-box-containing protein
MMLASRFAMYVAWGEDLCFLYNDAYAEIMGAKHPAALGKRFCDVWAEIWAFLEPLIAAARRGESTHQSETALVLKRKGFDETAWFSFSFSPVRDDDGRIAGMFCVCQEITDRILAERNLAAETERQRRQFSQAPGFICTLSGPEHVFDFVNEAFKRLFGDRDFVGKPIRQVIPEAEGQGFVQILDQVYATGVRFVAQAAPVRFRLTPDEPETERFLDFVYEPVTDADGQVIGIFCEGQDVTARYAAERARATLVQIGEAIGLLDEPEAIGRVAIGALGQALRVSRVGYADIEPDSKGLRPCLEWTAPGVAAAVDPLRLPDDSGFMAALQRGDFVHAEDVREDPRTAPVADLLESRNARALADAPIMEQGRLVAVLHVDSGTVRRWSPEELALIQDVAGRMRSAMERARAGQILRRTEQALRRANETLEQRVAEALAERGLLAEIVERTDAFVQVADLDYRWRAINAAAAAEFERIFGVRPRVGDSMLEAIAHLPAHQAAVRAAWGRALAGEDYTAVGEFGEAGRDRRFYEMKFNVLRDAEGRQIGAYQFVHDVTDRLRLQAHLRTIFETSQQFQGLIDLDGSLLEANSASLRAIDSHREAVAGQPYWDTPWFSATPGMPEQIRAAFAEVVARGLEFRAELTLTLPTGRRSFDFSLRPVLDDRGAVVAVAPEAVETTERRHAEEALRQSQKLESMGQLTGGVAHDFNNLLTPIIGGLDLLQRNRIGGEREQRLIAAAAQSAERAKVLVQRLLAFARRQPLQPRPVDVGELVSGMAELIASTSGPQIRVGVEVAADLSPAVADANQLEMALLNLAVNARDAMPEGGALRITADELDVGQAHHSQLQPGRYVRLSVADTGVGMDEATLARAVEPFFSTKGLGKGTGLGLSMAHGLASQLGGGLTIQSRLGVGTHVALWLPASARVSDGAEHARPAVAAGARRGLALLVDDEALVRMSTADMLGDLGYAVVEAASAEEALRRVSAGLKPDLLVTDHRMPGMSGVDLARALRAQAPTLGVLIVSGYAETEGLAPDLSRLTKPFRMTDLAASLADLKP